MDYTLTSKQSAPNCLVWGAWLQAWQPQTPTSKPVTAGGLWVIPDSTPKPRVTLVQEMHGEQTFTRAPEPEPEPTPEEELGSSIPSLWIPASNINTHSSDLSETGKAHSHNAPRTRSAQRGRGLYRFGWGLMVWRWRLVFLPNASVRWRMDLWGKQAGCMETPDHSTRTNTSLVEPQQSRST